MSTTVHVLRAESGWAVKREGNETLHVYHTQKEAIEGARIIARELSPGQVVVHGKDGAIRDHETFGMPKVLAPPRKSRLGTKRIEKAVNKLILERLRADLHQQRG